MFGNEFSILINQFLINWQMANLCLGFLNVPGILTNILFLNVLIHNFF